MMMMMMTSGLLSDFSFSHNRLESGFELGSPVPFCMTIIVTLLGNE